MVEMMEKKETSHWWWFDSHKSSNRSPWLQTTIAELDEKTKAILKLIEADADSFSKRAEMFYKKRPELICMVEDFYRAYRSLAERHDQVKSETGTRVLATFGSPFSSIKHKPQEPSSVMGQTYYSYSETSDTEDYAESEVENPEQEGDTEIENETDVEDPEVENETEVDKEIKEDEDSELEVEIQVVQEPKKAADSSEFHNDEIRMLREEIQRLKEENKMLEGQLTQKDEEKREVIRQLSLTVGVLKEENMKLRKYIAARDFKKSSPFEFNKLKEGFLGKLFSGSSKSRGSVFPL